MKLSKQVNIGDFVIGGDSLPVLIAGPCVIENKEVTLKCAEVLKKISEQLSINTIFKSSFDKANRSSSTSFRGPGLEDGLAILSDVKQKTGLPILSDVHSVFDIENSKEILDIIQIPAFLCRQTDLIKSASESGKTVNVKKGQFLSPSDMKNVISKFYAYGCESVLITERGTTFGYNDLVSDMRSIVKMRETACPIIFDASHSVQSPGSLGNESGGDRDMIFPLARAASAVGVDGFFIECHPSPKNALSDGPSMLDLEDLYDVTKTLLAIDKISRSS
jgi:2-dehydro-3-deoxyphosphooctonate aldolase (KDO 8-P synthase)